MGSINLWLSQGRASIPAPVPHSQEPPTPQVHPDPSGQWLVIQSELLAGETILYVPDPQHLKAAREAHPKLVAYGSSEVEELYAHRDAPDLLLAIHRIKKHFGGQVRPASHAASTV